ncbi:uncharacterized protein F5147DRAFT_657437 [Suillus discolor]|uniref:Uncharacterized protein n=1 Tax=Suillus discolor TaxID=1912936 RepID=A0A9P7EX50_9AGAM|nr:uncharacterized protein F5147DRAFT_657437 [Suillus discolor]KAG2093296.1 hypothetical protein F5147DRAFT_657437 [Suillus discolor]
MRDREIETLGLAETESNWLSIDATRQLLRLVRNCVSKVNGAASRILINMFLLRLASVMRNEEAEVNIIPKFPISKTTLQGHSFGGVVDFLINLMTLTKNFVTKDLLLDTPVAALASHNTHVAEHVTCNIFEAKQDNVKAAFPQAVVAAASYCKEHKLSVMRGCITSGEQRAFFIYNIDASDQGEVALAREIALGPNLEELPLLLGLLRDWVENARDYEQNFFEIK